MTPFTYEVTDEDDQDEYPTSTEPLIEKTKVIVRDSLFRSGYWTIAFACFVLVSLWAIKWSLSNITAKSCSQPQIRHEWRSLSSTERNEYIRAVKCLSSIPSSICNGTLHDEFAEIHKTIGNYSHEAAPFLPWHRYFIQIYEDTLKERCQYEGSLPYWDWTRDWTDITEASVFSATEGFGGNGNINQATTVGHAGCVEDGPFAHLHLQYYHSDWQPHCLSRGFVNKNLSSFISSERLNPRAMSSLLGESDYYKFLIKLEKGPHLALPLIIGGDFARYTAPNDPLFFLHHGQLDRLWWGWQNRDLHARTRFYNGPASHNSTERASLSDLIQMENFAPSIPVNWAMSTNNNVFCYKYED